MIERFVHHNGSIHYKIHHTDERHRPNGPAIIVPDQGWDWFLFGKYHRYYGPQCYYKTIRGGFEWWIHGKRIE